MPEKLVVIGDLNASVHALRHILLTLDIIDSEDRWIAKNVHVVQLGDVLNRGGDSKKCFDLLMKWEFEARKKKSQMTTLLGNHECMVLLGNYTWCYPEEFLSFASDFELEEYQELRSVQMRSLLKKAKSEDNQFSILGDLRAWECQNYVGLKAFKKAYSMNGVYGQWLRKRPLAIRIGPYVLSHAGLLPKYAELGLAQLNRLAREQWDKNPERFDDLPYKSPLTHSDGPLWNRVLAAAEMKKIQPAINKSLSVLNAEMMIIGHTRTEVIDGKIGEPLLRRGGQILCADTSIASAGIPSAAVLIEGGEIYKWASAQRTKICMI